MKLGEIFYFETDKVIGYGSRYKYHLYLGEYGWPLDGHSFLFINKGDYGGDYKILKADYSFFTLEYSYVGCNHVVPYSDEELAGLPPALGTLAISHLRELHAAVSKSKTMERRFVPVVCRALSAAF